MEASLTDDEQIYGPTDERPDGPTGWLTDGPTVQKSGARKTEAHSGWTKAF